MTISDTRPGRPEGGRSSTGPLCVTGLLASPDLTILEIDFHNPPWAPDHCPPSSTFVHHLVDGRSARLDIYYPGPGQHQPG